MRHTRETDRPRVFLSFAGDDRKRADQLRQALKKRDIEAFIFPPGGNLVLDIDEALTRSDYFVLLWSKACVERPWVSAEWSAAFARELQERRSFLFIVRLDETALPPLLAPRNYLDAVKNSDETMDETGDELAAIWYRDRAIGLPVLPAPHPIVTHNAVVPSPTIVLHVRNRALSVAHVIVAPQGLTGQRLDGLVRHELALPPDIVAELDGAVGIRFHYQLKNAGKLIPVDETPLSELLITDGTMIDLEVQIEPFAPVGQFQAVTLRGRETTRQVESPDLFPALTRSLINSALGHLLP